MAIRNPAYSRWPERFGRIGQSASYESPFFVFKIEDAHSEIEVQEGMADLISYLHGEYGVRVICLEGAAGGFRIQEIKSELGPTAARLPRERLRTKRLSASEYLALTTDLPLLLYGVEDPDQYRENAESLRRVRRFYVGVEWILTELVRHVEEMKSRIYNDDLRQFDLALARYEDGAERLGDFITGWLMPCAEQSGLALASFPRLDAFAGLLELEKSIEHGKVRAEQVRIIEDIADILGARQVERGLFDRAVRARLKLAGHDVAGVSLMTAGERLAEYREFVKDILPQLHDMATSIRQGLDPVSEMYATLLDLAGLCGVNVKRYPNLLAYSHLTQRFSRLPVKDLSEELGQLTDTVYEDMCGTSREREVLQAWRAVRFAQKLCQLELSAAEAGWYVASFGILSLAELLALAQDNEESGAIGDLRAAVTSAAAALTEGRVSERELLEGLSGRRTALGDREPIAALRVDLALKAAHRFYQLAPSRARKLAENTLRYMVEQNVTEAILVSGGFLTDQILAVLDREAVSYVVITPPIGPATVSRAQYLDSFTATAGDW